MNILLIGYIHGEGGIQTHTHFLAKGLVERGHDVTVLSPPPISNFGHQTARGVDRSYRLATYGKQLPDSDLSQISRREQFDVTVVCGTGWKSMVKTLTTIRTKRRVFFEVMSGDRSKRLDPRALVHFGFDAVVGQAPTVEEKFCESFQWRKQRTTIPALPEPLEVQADIPERTRLDSDGDGKLRMAYFGRLAPHKRVDFLIENWSVFGERAHSLDIWGGGEDRERLEGLVAAAGLGEQIQFRGRYPTGQAYVDELASYDLKLLATDGAEGAPLVLLEAMATGLPFIANGVGGIPGYANEDCAITSGDLGEFMPAYREWLRKWEAGEISPERLQQFYKDKFSYRALVDRWESFMTELLGPRAPLSRGEVSEAHV